MIKIRIIIIEKTNIPNYIFSLLKIDEGLFGIFVENENKYYQNFKCLLLSKNVVCHDSAR